jgi:hypothetical protein
VRGRGRGTAAGLAHWRGIWSIRCVSLVPTGLRVVVRTQVTQGRHGGRARLREDGRGIGEARRRVEWIVYALRGHVRWLNGAVSRVRE